MFIEKSTYSVYQTKLLLFMMADSETHLEHLQNFIFRHRKICRKPHCKCINLVDHLKSLHGNLSEDELWLDFIATYILDQFDLKEMSKLNLTKLSSASE
jgi:hypothetical protein